MPSVMSKIIKICLVLVSVSLIYGIYMYTKPVKKIASQKTDYQLSMEQMTADFQENQQIAHAKYKDKVLEISGVAKKITISDSLCSVIFDLGGNFIVIANCLVSEKETLKSLDQSSNLVLKGIYSGYIINDDMFMIPAEIKIDKCTILK